MIAYISQATKKNDMSLMIKTHPEWKRDINYNVTSAERNSTMERILTSLPR